MKYAIIIADGAADLPIGDLNDRTPLQAANTPNMDAISATGRLGTARTTPPGFMANSDVCTMCLLGNDPRKYHTGRAPLEAAAMGVAMSERDWIFRLNLVCVGETGTSEDGQMLDHSAGAITDGEATVLITDLFKHWQLREPVLTQSLMLRHGVSYRSVLVDRSGLDYSQVVTTPPHEIPGQPWAASMPGTTMGSGAGSREGAERLRMLMNLAAEVLPDHPINSARRAIGQRPANMAWIWGQGVRPMLPKFADQFGMKGAMTTAVDLLAGIATLMGWDKLTVAGVTSYHDNDYAAQGRATVAALDTHDIVCCHVEAPDEMSHQGDFASKVASIESIDKWVVGPVLEKLKSFGDLEKDPKAAGWRILILPDHYTLCSTRKHDATPVPFAMAGAWVRSLVSEPYCEQNAADSDLHIEYGHELMEYFLKGGRVGVM